MDVTSESDIPGMNALGIELALNSLYDINDPVPVLSQEQLHP